MLERLDPLRLTQLTDEVDRRDRPRCVNDAVDLSVSPFDLADASRHGDGILERQLQRFSGCASDRRDLGDQRFGG